MVKDERARFLLHGRLEELLGSEQASTLMEHLPPTGWADVATKQDLRNDIDALEQRILARLSEMEADLTRTTVLAVVGSVLSSTALSFAAATLA